MTRAAFVPVLLGACLLAGCRSLPSMLQNPPRMGAFDGMAEAVEHHWPSQRFVTHDGIELRYRRVNLGGPPIRTVYIRSAEGFNFEFSFDLAAPATAQPPPAARGTVVYLHGWGMSGDSMLPWASALSEHGLSGITVDLRNHGGSGKGTPGFGRLESQDVAELISALRREGAITPPVYLFGVSYGAATAVFTAQRSRGDVEAVVAMEPFDNAADAVRGFVRADGLVSGGGVAATLQRGWLRHRFPPRRVDAQIASVERRFGYALADVDVSQALLASRTCTLLIHGALDRQLAASASQRMAEAAAPLAHYVPAPYDNHFTLPLRVEWLSQPIAQWLVASGAECAAPAFAADPLPPMR